MTLCRDTAYATLESNINLEYEIFTRGCFNTTLETTVSPETSPIITETTSIGPCEFNYTLFSNALANTVSEFETNVADLYSNELLKYESDATTQNLFQAGIIDESCSSFVNQIVPALGVHETFLACVQNVENSNDNAVILFTDTMNRVFSNCGLKVSIILNHATLFNIQFFIVATY